MRVLVIDDERSIRAVVRRALDEMDVVEVADGPIGLELLAQERFDLVLLDVMLPAMDGFEVLARIRSTEAIADLPVVMLTALTTEGDHVRGFRAGADAYVTKPFDVDELSEVVNEVFARSAEERLAIRRRELDRAELLHHLETQFRA